MSYEVAIVGTGPSPDERSRSGYAMGYRHAAAYLNRDDCELIACADIVPANAEAFATEFGIPASRVYDGHLSMLEDVNPDVVSVCVPPAEHARIVIDCAQIGEVDAVHCEKPMATSWKDCREMVSACEQAGVQLTIDHQRRFARPVVHAKRLLEDGRIGELRRMEWSEVNLYDAGSHLFDLCDHFVDGARAEWVLAAVDASEEHRWFGALNSTQAIAHWGYDTGVDGFASTGDGGRKTLVDAYLRLVGEDGVIEIEPESGPPLRIRTDGTWETIDADGERLYGPTGSRLGGAIAKLRAVTPGVSARRSTRPNYARAIDHAIEALTAETEPIISGAAALRGTEVIFGAWESARQRGRVDFPLQIDDNPLEAIVNGDRGHTIPQ